MSACPIDPPAAAACQFEPMTSVLRDFRDPTKTDFAHAWVGMEPTFQNRKSIRLWSKYAARPGGEDEYFKDPRLLKTQRRVSRAIVKEYRSRKSSDADYCVFDRVDVKRDLDQWQVDRRNIIFHWEEHGFERFEVRFCLDPETFEYSVKPVPAAWFYDARFVRFLDEFLWKVPLKLGLAPSVCSGGGQFSLSVKTFLTGSLLADDIATRLNHPELATWVMDWPNGDDRAFRATRPRFDAFRRVLSQYWSGAFHPQATGVPTAGDVLLDRPIGPGAAPRPDLMDPLKGPVGDADDVFRANFAFGRAVRRNAQSVHCGYWQAQHWNDAGYRPDQVPRYSEANLCRMQIAGELHVKSGKQLNPKRIPEWDQPLDRSMLTTEAGWEIRGQMGRTSARDFVEALLLDIHYAQHLQKNPHVEVRGSILQDQLLIDGEETVRRHAGQERLDRLRQEARRTNLDDSHGRVKSDFIEPESLLWEAWRALPKPERSLVAEEAVLGFVDRVRAAAACDPRPDRESDPMEWHRHRICPALWEALADPDARRTPCNVVAQELAAWQARRPEHLSRRPIFSHIGEAQPWESAEGA